MSHEDFYCQRVKAIARNGVVIVLMGANKYGTNTKTATCCEWVHRNCRECDVDAVRELERLQDLEAGEKELNAFVSEPEDLYEDIPDTPPPEEPETWGGPGLDVVPKCNVAMGGGKIPKPIPYK